MNNKNRLGRGLSSIFNQKTDASHENSNVIHYMNINNIRKNPFQPRTNIIKKELEQLAESISTYGLIQPITVRKKGNSQYELISGERRLRASLLAGLKKIPVFVKDVKNQNMLAVALVENIQRKDLDPIEIALSLDNLIKNHNITQESLSKKIGKSRSTISNYIRLLKLDPIIQAGIRDSIITMGHAKAIINITNQNTQLEIYQNIIYNKLSVRETELMVKKSKLIKPQTNKKNHTIRSEHYIKIEKSLSDFFNQKITLKLLKNGKGKIEIPFQSEKKLDDIIKLLQSY